MMFIGMVFAGGIYFAQQGYALKTHFESSQGKLLGLSAILGWASVPLVFIHFSPVMTRLLGIEGENARFYKNLLLKFQYLVYIFWIIYIPVFLFVNISLSLFFCILMSFNVFMNILTLYPTLQLLNQLLGNLQDLISHINSCNTTNRNLGSYKKFRTLFTIPEFNVRKDMLLFGSAVTSFWPACGIPFLAVFSHYILPGKQSCFAIPGTAQVVEL
eukprot:snap_masked-scaffold_8-processed-gene-8.55-mRNA-1 protein AED:1.00 eAED:1.00 QI:0/0/0/0/1/1/2/0/214